MRAHMPRKIEWGKATESPTLTKTLELVVSKQRAGAAQNGGEGGSGTGSSVLYKSSLQPHVTGHVVPIVSAMTASCFICSSTEGCTAGSAQQASG